MTFHHLGFFFTAFLTNNTLYHRKDALVRCLYIHFPFLFSSIKRSTANTAIQSVSDKMFLILWFPVSGYRLMVIFNSTADAYNKRELFNTTILLLMCVVFTALDFSWTPWKKYRKILNI